jgi:hypothetical protein
MDWLTFISNLVGSLSWPAAFFAVAFLFRSQVQYLMNSLTKLKWRDVEVEFGEQVDLIREEVQEAGDDPKFRDEPVEPRLIQLADEHPHLAVLESWKQLEKAIIDLSIRKLGTQRSAPALAHIEAVLKSDLLPASMTRAIREIREVRNRAAHDVGFSISRGRAYILLDTIADVVGFLARVE